jgi:hypothetical protein
MCGIFSDDLFLLKKLRGGTEFHASRFRANIGSLKKTLSYVCDNVYSIQFSTHIFTDKQTKLFSKPVLEYQPSTEQPADSRRAKGWYFFSCALKKLCWLFF